MADQIMSNELMERFASTDGLSPRAERQVSRQIEQIQGSALARAYRVEMESQLAQRKVAALSSVARHAMSETAIVHSVEDTLIKSLQGTAVGSVAVDRIDLIAKEYAIAAGDIMLNTARHISSL